MILFAAAVGALLGWIASDFSFGIVPGGMLGALMGLWLRAAVRGEVAAGIAKARAEWEREIASRADAVRRPEADMPAEAAARSRRAEETAVPTAAAARVERAPTVAPQPRPAVASAAYATSEPEMRSPPEPTIVERWMVMGKDWLLGGNTIVRVGLLILFVGLSFLASYAASAGWFPIEVRLALVGLAGAGLLGFGYYKRIEKPDFGLALQGAGVAVLYLTVFAAARIFGLMPPALSFGLMVVFAALGCALALLQNARVMAFISLLGGYAVPMLLGGEGETPLPLFSYITILNAALLVIAWRRSWRELNLLGFFATFGMAMLWAALAYEPQHYLICQIFLGLTVVIFLAAAVLYAHNTPGPFGNVADSTLLFGPALVGFGLEVGLVHDRPYYSAFAALAFGALYLGVAAWAMRQRRSEMRLVNECLLAIGVGFATLAVPLALDAQWTSAAWALEGAGAFWVGARQARWMPRAFGLFLQLVAAGIVLVMLDIPVAALPFAHAGFMGPMLVAVPLLLTAWWMRQPLPHSGSAMAQGYASLEWGVRQAVFLIGFSFVALALVQEIIRELPATSIDGLTVALFAPWQQMLLVMLALLLAAALAEAFGRRRAWPVATWPAAASLPIIALFFLSARSVDRHLLYWPDIAAWAAALAMHGWLLWRSDRALASTGEGPRAPWNFAVHAMGVWLLVAMVADSLQLGIDRLALWDSSWAGVSFLISAVAVLLLLERWAGRAAPLATTDSLRWPLHRSARAYWLVGALPVALLVYAGALVTAAFAEGVTDPLPYVPLFNPVDLSVALAIGALLLWRRMLLGAHRLPEGSRSAVDKGGLIAVGVLAFVAINGVWLRTAHHWLGAEWSGYGLWDNSVVQLGLAILWSMLALGLMLFAHRRALRYSWLVGAGLLGIVVIKLLLVDMSTAQGWERIVTFIGVGLLMLVIGYFVPLPPRAGGAVEAKVDGAKEAEV